MAITPMITVPASTSVEMKNCRHARHSEHDPLSGPAAISAGRESRGAAGRSPVAAAPI